MIIKSALVARGTFVICEYDASTGNDDLNEISRKVLGKIPKTGAIRSYVYAGHTFNYMLDKDIIFLCIAAMTAGSELVFQFLRDLRARYEKMARQSSSADRSSELARMLQVLLSSYNNDNSSTKVRQMEQELEDVTEMMRDNIGKVMERGEKIESLLDKTSLLKSESLSFRTTAKNYNDKLWWQDQKGRLILAACVSVIVLFFVWRTYESRKALKS